MPRQTVPITNFVPNHPEYLTYVNSIYGIKMQYKRTGGYIYELANGTTHDLVSFSPIIANQTAALNSLRLHFHLTPATESQLKKTYTSGIPDFNASLRLSVYYPENKGKTVSQYASEAIQSLTVKVQKALSTEVLYSPDNTPEPYMGHPCIQAPLNTGNTHNTDSKISTGFQKSTWGQIQSTNTVLALYFMSQNGFLQRSEQEGI